MNEVVQTSEGARPLTLTAEYTNVERATEITCLYRNVSQAFEYLVRHRPTWAWKNSEARLEHEEYLEKVLSEGHAEEVREMPSEQLGWLDLDSLARDSLDDMLGKWQAMRWQAREELDRGFTGAAAVCSSKWGSPWELAGYLAQRDRLAEDLKPRTGVERALIDLLAQSYCAYTHWMAIMTQRMIWPARELTKEEIEWELPRKTEAEAIEQARAMADSFHRMFMRTLRQLRDWRKMSAPVVVQNLGGQVNVAAGGGQQVNLARADAT